MNKIINIDFIQVQSNRLVSIRYLHLCSLIAISYYEEIKKRVIYRKKIRVNFRRGLKVTAGLRMCQAINIPGKQFFKGNMHVYTYVCANYVHDEVRIM